MARANSAEIITLGEHNNKLGQYYKFSPHCWLMILTEEYECITFSSFKSNGTILSGCYILIYAIWRPNSKGVSVPVWFF